MELIEEVNRAAASKATAGKYIEEVRLLLPKLQGFMEDVLAAQGDGDGELLQYLVGMVRDTAAGIENQDEVLLRDVLEYGWRGLIIDVMGEEDSDAV